MFGHRTGGTQDVSRYVVTCYSTVKEAQVYRRESEWLSCATSDLPETASPDPQR